MDKYEYKLRTEQMIELMEDGNYPKAAEIADSIDWNRVRNTMMLTNVSDIYEKINQLEKSYKILNIAYQRADGSRKIIYRLCTLALKTGNLDEALDFYDDFIEIAPKDPNRFILRYQILRARRESTEQQIEALENFKKAEYIEEWAYELAKLYQEAGMTAECLEECDDLILWFSEGKYVYQAMELKKQYKPLTPSQQEKYDRRFENLQAENGDFFEEEPAVEKPAVRPVVKPMVKPAAASVAPEPVTVNIQEETTTVVSDVPVQSKQKLGQTMDLGEALQSLLQPKIDEEMEIADKRVDTASMEKAIEAIESGADLELPKKQEKKKTVQKIETEEAQEESDQVDGQLSIEDMLQNMMAGVETEADDTVSDVKSTGKEKAEKKAKAKPTLQVVPKVAEPVLAPEIQRMIDEIEGKITPADPVAKPVDAAEEVSVKQAAKKKSSTGKKGKPKKEQSREAVANKPKVAGALVAEDEYEEYDEIVFGGEEEEEELVPVAVEENVIAKETLVPAEDVYDEDEEYFEDGEYIEDDEDEILSLEDSEDFEEDVYDDLEDDLDLEEAFEDADILRGDASAVKEMVEEEFKPVLQDEEDDVRIVPKKKRKPSGDEEDILRSTAPLSRKETAKLHATGKTAPLPVDEISDALSLNSTGFVVQGRYDLESQSGVGTRAGLTEEQKKLFSYFVPVRGMSEQLVDVLEQDKNCNTRGGTSRTGNLLIIGSKGSGKTVLAVDVVKAIQKQRNIRQGKVAIVTGDALNKKRISDIVEKLHGGALIVEKAGRMNEKTVARLNKAMESDTGELLLVLEEQRKPLDRMLSTNREFRRKFTSRLEVPIFINDELVTFGQTYAQENGYRIDEMGILALYSKIDAKQREDHAVTVAEVKEMMDAAMGYAQRSSAKKLVKRVLGRGTDEADRIILSEKDFMY
ncbi:MAG: ATP-binding protein [Lachnospiraceae bacterium]|nr:ATP-binding protein [Lachnospiraceae bacterium]